MSAEVTLRLESTIAARSSMEAQALALQEVRLHGELVGWRACAEEKI